MDRNSRRRTPTKWRQEDNEELLVIVQQYAQQHPNSNLNWKFIAKTLNQSQSTNFTGAQCHQHYWRVVNPNINRSEFTEEEDQLLLDLYESIGENRWSKISKAMEGRTDSQCRQRFLQLKAEMQKMPSKRARKNSTTEHDENSTTAESPTSPAIVETASILPSPQNICSESVHQAEIPVRKSEPILDVKQTAEDEDTNLYNQDFFDYLNQISDTCFIPTSTNISSLQVAAEDVTKYEIILEQRIDRVVGTGLTTIDKASLLPSFVSFSHEIENSQNNRDAIQLCFPIVSVHEFEIPSQESQNTLRLFTQG